MRLTNEMRREIVAKAVTAAYGKREDAHNAATKDLADALYQHTYGEAEKIARKLPKGFANMSGHIEIDAPGFRERYSTLGLKNSQLNMSIARPVPANHTWVKIPVGGAHPLNDQAQAVAEEYQALKRDKDALSAKLCSLVGSATTVEKLLEAWPAGTKYVGKPIPPKPSAVIPVELVPEINAAIAGAVKPAALKAPKAERAAAVRAANAAAVKARKV